MLPVNAILQNRYQIIRLLGQGGMGAVYLAFDRRLNQQVALKENTGGDAHQFQQEAQLLARLRHPNLPRVIDHFVEPNGAQYLVMDYIEGEDLETMREQQGALPEAQVRVWFDQILDAVAYLHSQGIVHRDIKPENIKITPADRAILVDFGIAKVHQSGQYTRSSQRMGTPGYASPEHYRGGTEQRSDIYSLGATLYGLLTGRIPPDASALESGSALLASPRNLNAMIVPESERVILRAMQPQLMLRFENAEEFRSALSGNLPPPLPPKPPKSKPSAVPLFIAGGVAVVVIGALLWFILPKPQADQVASRQPTAGTPVELANVVSNTPTTSPSLVPTLAVPSDTTVPPTTSPTRTLPPTNTETTAPTGTIAKRTAFPSNTSAPTQRATVSASPVFTVLSSSVSTQGTITRSPEANPARLVFSPPMLFDPPDNSHFTNNAVLRWNSAHVLQVAQLFDVLVWPQGSTEQTSIGTTSARTFSIDFKTWKYNTRSGKFFWTIRIRQNGGEYLSAGATPRYFLVGEQASGGTPIASPSLSPRTTIPRSTDHPTPDNTTPDTPTPDNPTPDNTTPDTPTPDNPTPDNPTPDNPTPDNPTPDNPTPDNPTPDNPTPDNPTPDNPTPDNPTPDNPTPDNPTPDTPTPGEPVTEGQTGFKKLMLSNGGVRTVMFLLLPLESVLCI